MLTGFMLQMCGFATIDRGGWISTNVLVVLLAVTIAALVYAIGNFFPVERREKLRGTVRYEIVEAFISLVIIITLILFAAFTCNAGGALVGQAGYSGVFNAADGYVGALLFTNGAGLMGNLYTASVQYEVVYNLLYAGSEFVWSTLSTFAKSSTAGIISFGIPIWGAGFFREISMLFSTVYAGALDASFGGLFILFLLLKIIEACALTIVVPTAILMRTIPFAGPQLRRTSNLLLAMAVGFYFVFPTMVVLNNYVASCLSLKVGVAQAACANYPFLTYLKGYVMPMAPSSLFTSGTTYPVSSSVLPSFASGSISIPLSFFSAGLNGGFIQILSTAINGGAVALQYGTQVAAYVFLGIVLIALDLGVTAGFIIGISKGLDSISSGNAFGAGPFFGG
jgi:hypothetical protein